MRGTAFWAGLTAVILVLTGAAVWLGLAPSAIRDGVIETAQNQLGRTLTVKGGAHLTFSPLSVRLDDVSLAGAGADGEAFLLARSVTIPVGFGDLLAHGTTLSTLAVEGGELAFLLSERGEPSWGFAAVKSPQPLRIEFSNSAARYFDARNGQAARLPALSGVVQIEADGRMVFQGSSEINGRLLRIDAALKSLARVHEDGSPLDVSVILPEASLSFDGRIATAKALSFAGPMSLSVPDLRGALRWAGLALGEGSSFKALTLDGALDSAARAFAVRRANLNLDGAPMSGDVVLDLRNETPKFQADLEAQNLDLDTYLPVSKAQDGEWSSLPLGVESLRQFEAELALSTPALSALALEDVPARLTATVKGGKLSATVTARPQRGGSLGLMAAVDASALPPVVTLDLQAREVEATDVLSGLFGFGQLSGTGDVVLSASGTGQTAQEIVGTLSGTASLVLKDGQILGLDLGSLLKAVTERILEGWGEDASATTSFSALDGSGRIADGIVTLDSLAVETPQASLSLAGSTDLLRRAIDLKIAPRTGGADARQAFPVQIIAKGPWRSPRIYPDLPDVLLDPKTAFESLKSSGN